MPFREQLLAALMLIALSTTAAAQCAADKVQVTKLNKTYCIEAKNFERQCSNGPKGICKQDRYCWCPEGHVCKIAPNSDIELCYPTEEHQKSLLRQRQQQRREARRTSQAKNCANPLLKPGAWEYECPKQTSYNGNLPDISARANRECAGVSAQQRDKCLSQNIANIMIAEDPAASRCNLANANAKASCIAQLIAERAALDNLRQRLSSSIFSKDAYNDPDLQKPPPTAEPSAPREPKPAETTSLPPQEDSIYCDFILASIHNRNAAYTRLDQVPEECRGRSDIKEALDVIKKNTFEMQSKDRQWIKDYHDYLFRLWNHQN